MTIITIFIENDYTCVKVNTGYINSPERSREIYRGLLLHGFKKDKSSRFFVKNYYKNSEESKQYTDERFNNDLDMLKKIDKYYEVKTYNVMNKERNF